MLIWRMRPATACKLRLLHAPMNLVGRSNRKDYDSEEPCLGSAEMYPEGDWTFVAEDFLDLASQIRDANAASSAIG